MRLIMTRDHLQNIPPFPVPPGFSIRWYAPGDEDHWLRIHLAADAENEITPDLFARAFGSDITLLHERQCYLIAPGGLAIGTATAWFDDDFQGSRYGRVHYVAVLPEYQGRGLGKALMTAVCLRLHDLGHDRAYLTTSTSRPAAIALYKRFGFEQRLIA